jgi:hypothetical protein
MNNKQIIIFQKKTLDNDNLPNAKFIKNPFNNINKKIKIDILFLNRRIARTYKFKESR